MLYTQRQANPNEINSFPLLSFTELSGIPIKLSSTALPRLFSQNINNYGIFDYLLIGLILKLALIVTSSPVLVTRYFGYVDDDQQGYLYKFFCLIARTGDALIGCIDFIARNVFACIGTAALLPVLAISEATGFSDYIEPKLPEMISMKI